MSKWLRLLGANVLLGCAMVGCSTMTVADREARRMDMKVTVDDPAHPRRIRFDLFRTPYAANQDQRLSVYEQIRLGMRRFAGEELAARGLCPHGFAGPDRVAVPENDREHRFFYVGCLPSAH